MERYVIHVTKECNCDCLYCYESDKTSAYDWEEIKEFIDMLLKHRTKDTFGIEFLGGEPMLAWDLIKKSYEYLEEKEEIEVEDYIITTNGTILDEEIVDYLSKNLKITFAISMDGHKYSNQLRVFKNGRKNTYDKVMSNIKLLNEHEVSLGVHMVTHPYNVAMISSSIDHLYRNNIRSIDIGTVEKTILIDEKYCERFIEELDLVSQRIIEGKYPDLRVSILNYLKPESDVRSYIIDNKTGKTVAESYGRSGEDITHTDEYKINRCVNKTEISKMINNIRKTVYDVHQKRLIDGGVIDGSKS